MITIQMARKLGKMSYEILENACNMDRRPDDLFSSKYDSSVLYSKHAKLNTKSNALTM